MNSTAENTSLTPLQKAFKVIEALKARLKAAEQQQTKQRQAEPIAIIGMACRFPGGVETLDDYWQLLESGTDAVKPIPASRWDHSQYYDPNPDATGKTYVRESAFLDQVDGFDADFFGLAPREVNSLDPQQRLLLEVAWEALEQAGMASDRLRDTTTGIFTGIGQNDYLTLLRESRADVAAGMYTGTGNGFCFASGRLSYLLGLRGPSLSVDTACSSSLVAVHLACQSLMAGECQLAIAAGVQLILSPTAYLMMSGSRALSADGRCKTFSAEADGYGRGEGCGVVVLKKLSQAQADGDHILAVIPGSAVNHDGASSGLTVPSGAAQVPLLQQALQAARLSPNAVSYVEAHGTGTPLGDPVEFRALGQVYGQQRAPDSPLYIGSVKTNLGHLEAAAGMAGLIKVVLSLQHNCLPRQLHFSQPNPAIAWREFPMRVVEENRPWQSQSPRVAGVSAFGLSGTNAHVLVSDPPAAGKIDQPQLPESLSDCVLMLSAKSPAALTELCRRYIACFQAQRSQSVAALCQQARQNRNHYRYRLAIAANHPQEFIERLTGAADGQASPFVVATKAEMIPAKPRLAFLFSGQGAQRVGMARALYQSDAVFRQALQQCHELMAQEDERLDLLGLINQAGAEEINQTRLTQPLLFAVEYALAQSWLARGLEPFAMVGHSVGEYVAACLAGIFSLEDGVKLICARARLMSELPQGGAMLAVMAQPQVVFDAIAQCFSGVHPQPLEMAAINAPNRCVVSGTANAIEQLETYLTTLTTLTTQEIASQRLAVSHAFHCALMEPMLAAYREVLQTVTLAKPVRRIIPNTFIGAANVGAANDPDLNTDPKQLLSLLDSSAMSTPEYWLAQIRQPVLFAQDIAVLQHLGVTAYLEVGPQSTLLGLAREQLGSQATLIPSLKSQYADSMAMAMACAALYCGGFLPLATASPLSRSMKLPLPTYPWQRQRYWFEASVQPPQAVHRNTDLSRDSNTHPMLGARTPVPALKTWLYTTDYSVENFPLLQDHCIYHRVVVAGATHLSLLLAVAQDITQQACVTLSKVVFPMPLVLADGQAVTLQTLVQEEGDADHKIKLTSFAEAGEHCEHVLANLQSDNVPVTAIESIELWQKRCPVPQDVNAFYQTIAAHHIELGPAFRWIQQLWTGTEGGRYLACCRMRAGHGSELQGFGLYPGLIDSCFQAMGAAVPDEYAKTYIPVGMDSMTLATGKIDLSQALWCFVSLQPFAEPAGQEYDFSGEILLTDAQGAVIARFNQVKMKEARPEAIKAAITANAVNPVTPADRYQLSWQPASLPQTHAGQDSVTTLLIGSFANDAHIQSGFPSDWIVLTPEQLPEFLTRDTQGEALRVIFWLGSRISPVEGDAIEWIKRAGGELLAVQQALIRYQSFAPDVLFPELYLITSQAQAVATEAVDPLAAAVWGMARSFREEYPVQVIRCIDLPLDDVQPAAQLLNQTIGGTEDFLCYRDKTWYAARFTSTQPLSKIADKIQYNQGAYLMSGASGTLGLATAKALIERGARRLILLARDKAKLDQQQAIQEWRRQGLLIETVAADISTFDSVARIQSQVSADSLQKVRGIIHGAGVLADGLVSAMTEQQLMTVVLPKVAGAQHLLALVDRKQLDFFVSYSSAAALLGSAGQANYSFANAWLDGLMLQMRQQGIPAFSINWGPWAGSGMVQAQQQGHAQRLKNQGIALLEPEAALQTLFALIGTETFENTAVLSVNWPQLLSKRQRPGDQALFSAFATRQYTGENTEENSRQCFIDELAALADRYPESYLHDKLAEHLQTCLLSVLGKPAQTKVARDLGFTEMGMDSLMALEFRTRLQQDFCCQLPSTLVYKYSNLAELTGFMVRQDFYRDLLKKPVNEAVEETEALDEENLTEDELAALLAAELEAGE